MKQRMRRAWRASKPVVQAPAFEVVDDAGAVIAWLGPLPGAEAERPGVGLALLDSDGAGRMTLGVDSVGAAIHVTAMGAVVLSIAVLDPEPPDLNVRTLLAVRTIQGHEIVTLELPNSGL